VESIKNLHLLPTSKPSRLSEFGGQFTLTTESTDAFRNYNIYITSDEEIKEGDSEIYILVQNNILLKDGHVVLKLKNVKHVQGAVGYLEASFYKSTLKIAIRYCSKIILTTDRDLIKDGVQSIDDEFLEWFVENPSCEEVEVIVLNSINVLVNNYKPYYKIIIPQEEPKTGSMTECVKMIIDSQLNELEELKQETLEEVAEIELGKLAIQNSKRFASKSEVDYTLGFIQGAKLQTERMYSEEEVLEILYKSHNAENTSIVANTIMKWFEKFKKK
jgi:hypothetical protein